MERVLSVFVFIIMGSLFFFIILYMSLMVLGWVERFGLMVKVVFSDNSLKIFFLVCIDKDFFFVLVRGIVIVLVSLYLKIGFRFFGILRVIRFVFVFNVFIVVSVVVLVFFVDLVRIRRCFFDFLCVFFLFL